MDIKGFKSKDGTVHQYDYDALANKPEAPGSGGNVELTGVVKSVNGQTPDENGNVEIDASRPTDEQVNTAVNAFLEENPVSSGIGSKASALLITILRNGVYNTNQSANITALENALKSSSGGSSGGSGDSGGTETPDEPENPEVTLSSISATYSGGDVPAGTSVLALSEIVVTAHYSDGSTATVEDYELSGEIAEGSNTVTVTYGGMTATFTVTGTVETSGSYTWSDGYFNTNGGIYKADGHKYCEEYIPIIPGEYFFVYGADPEWPGTEVKFCFYDSEKNFLVRCGPLNHPSPAEYEGIIFKSERTAPDNAAFVRVSVKNVSGYENIIDMSTDCPEPHLPFESTTWVEGVLNANGNVVEDNASSVASNNYTGMTSMAVSVEAGATYRFGNSNAEWTTSAVGIKYNSNIFGDKVSVTREYSLGSVAYYDFTVPDGVKYVRICARKLVGYSTTATLEKIS